MAALIGILKKKHRSRFSSGDGKGDYMRHQDYMKKKLEGFPRINQAYIQGGLQKMECVAPLCVTDLELRFYQLLHKTFKANIESAYDGNDYPASPRAS